MELKLNATTAICVGYNYSEWMTINAARKGRLKTGLGDLWGHGGGGYNNNNLKKIKIMKHL